MHPTEVCRFKSNHKHRKAVSTIIHGLDAKWVLKTLTEAHTTINQVARRVCNCGHGCQWIVLTNK